MQDHARRARRGDRRSAQARAEAHRPSLLGDATRRPPRSASTISSTGSWRPPTSSPTSSPTSVPGQTPGQQTIAAARPGGRAVQGAREDARRPASRAHVDADGVRDVHAGPADAAGPRRAAARAEGSSSSRATRATAPEQRPSTRRCFRRGMALERAFAKAGGMLVAGTDPTGSGRRDSRLLEPAAARAARRRRLHAARGDHDRHAQRREVSRPRRADRHHRRRQAGRSRRRSPAIRRRRSRTSARSRRCSGRASASTRRS